jgi:hypothetical protein
MGIKSSKCLECQKNGHCRFFLTSFLTKFTVIPEEVMLLLVLSSFMFGLSNPLAAWLLEDTDALIF